MYYALGMILPRKWVATLGGSLQMDLSYATILIGNEGYATLYNQPRMKNHVEDPNNKDAWTNHEFDTPLKLHEEDHHDGFCEEPLDPHLDPNLSQDLAILLFAQEDSNGDVIWPKREDCQEKFDKYKDNEMGSITILNHGNEEKLHLHEDDRKNITLIKSHPPTLDQKKDTEERKGTIDSKIREEDFQQGRLVLMWDTKKGKPNMHKEFDCLWQGPYKIEKKSGTDSFYFSMPK
jgi:hypothetical protein